MKSQPRVSVVTATYQNLDTLKRTVESVRSQRGLDVEHVVVDGGSRDGTADWLGLQEGLVWISEPDAGIADAMNKGAALASGEWLLFLQADDRLASGEVLANAVGAWDGESDLIASPIRFEGGRELKPRCDRAYYRFFKQGILHQGVLIRSEAFKRIGNYDTQFRVTMDYDWFLRAHWSKARVQVREETLAIMGESGVSSQADWAHLRKRFGEEQRSRLQHAPNTWWRLLYGAYWCLYLPVRYLANKVSR